MANYAMRTIKREKENLLIIIKDCNPFDHIDIGNEIFDIKRMITIDKTTRMRKPVKRISDYDIN